MQITEQGRGVFIVTAHGEDFYVDTLDLRGAGQCSCIHFNTRLKPEIERLIQARSFVPGPEFTCPHIKYADAHLLTMFKKSLREQFPDNEQTI